MPDGVMSRPVSRGITHAQESSSVGILAWAGDSALTLEWESSPELKGWSRDSDGARAIETNSDPIFDGDEGFAAAWEAEELVYDEVDLVLLETMPDQHRASHEAAGQWGHYPANGAIRRIVPREEAEQLIAEDEDGYDHIVRTATEKDRSEYEAS
jgi:hypothetical protein